MKIQGSIALVTGANRGLGLAFAQALLARGANKVYAAARDPKTITLDGVVPLKLDVTNADDIAAAARAAGDVNLVINNAGIALAPALLDADGEDALRRQLETNLFGPLAISRAFAPALAANGGGALVNMLSALSWLSLPTTGAYSVSKSAAWALTNGLRHELRAQGTHVVGLHAAFIDTEMAAHVSAPKTSAADVARIALDGVEAGQEEILIDEVTRQVKGSLSTAKPAYLGA
ncbi:SDR family oxidoreductase [Caldimonas sp. KR1-144]|uniref:SDR family oxidoreductase n=1 Tax=Caldimonas sp. KR1-144 TaxID=3400911 RepID=UPI003C1123F0